MLASCGNFVIIAVVFSRVLRRDASIQVVLLWIACENCKCWIFWRHMKKIITISLVLVALCISSAAQDLRTVRTSNTHSGVNRINMLTDKTIIRSIRSLIPVTATTNSDSLPFLCSSQRGQCNDLCQTAAASCAASFCSLVSFSPDIFCSQADFTCGNCFQNID